jgi:hypothetical protein
MIGHAVGNLVVTAPATAGDLTCEQLRAYELRRSRPLWCECLCGREVAMLAEQLSQRPGETILSCGCVALALEKLQATHALIAQARAESALLARKAGTEREKLTHREHVRLLQERADNLAVEISALLAKEDDRCLLNT